MHLAPASRRRRLLGLGIAVAVVSTIVIVETVLILEAHEVQDRGRRLTGRVEAINESRGVPTSARVAISVDGAPRTVEVLLAGVERVPVPGERMDVRYLRVGSGYHVAAADEDLRARMLSDGIYATAFAGIGVWLGLVVAGVRRGRPREVTDG